MPGKNKLLKSGDILFRTGDASNGMFLIRRGQLEVYLEKDGAEISLAKMGAGAMLGEMALFDNNTRSASARAVEDTEVTHITTKEFDTIMKKGKKGKTGKRRRLDDDRSEDMENGIVVYILGTDAEVPKTPEEIAILSKGRRRPKFPKTYVGYTNDIRARLEKHRTGKGALDTSWTSDWRVIAIVRGFASMPHARHFEHVIHYMSGAGDRVKEPFTLIKKHRGASHQVRQLTVALSRPDAKGLRVDWHWDKSSSKGQLPSVLMERSVQKSTEPKS